MEGKIRLFLNEPSYTSIELSNEPLMQKAKLVVLKKYEFENQNLLLSKRLTFSSSRESEAKTNVEDLFLEYRLQERGRRSDLDERIRPSNSGEK